MIKYIIYFVSYTSNYDTLNISGRFIVTEKEFTYYTRDGYKTLPIAYTKFKDRPESIYILDNGKDRVTMFVGYKEMKYSIKDEHIKVKRKHRR